MQEQSDVGLGAGRPAVLMKVRGLGRVSFPYPWAGLRVQCPIAARVPADSEATVHAPVFWPPPRLPGMAC